MGENKHLLGKKRNLGSLASKEPLGDNTEKQIMEFQICISGTEVVNFLALFLKLDMVIYTLIL
jgi:hypothetical protein